jgi:hypothetical protein
MANPSGHANIHFRSFLCHDHVEVLGHGLRNVRPFHNRKRYHQHLTCRQVQLDHRNY